ncbi:MAG: hypothetical protein JXQ84_03585, partial [Rhodospirillaceae bacterium]|nr:hypothetical protein [Rhodospirillaceae bacterium]
MQIVAEGFEGAGMKRRARALSVGFVGALGLLLAGCSSSYNPVNWFGDDAPKPQQIALPAEDAADQGTLPQGLSADAGHDYADGARSDVSVVRPLRNEPPPNVAVGAASSTAPIVSPAPGATASFSDMPVAAPEAEK